MIPKVTNVCTRCESDQIEIQPNKIYTCKACGKAEKTYTLKVRFEFPEEVGGEKKTVRNLPREMAGQMSEQIGRVLAVGIAGVVESFGAQIPKNVAPMLLTRAIGASLGAVFEIMAAFLPLELQQELAEYNALVSKANTLMEAARNARVESVGPGPVDRETPGVPGQVGGVEEAGDRTSDGKDGGGALPS